MSTELYSQHCVRQYLSDLGRTTITLDRSPLRLSYDIPRRPVLYRLELSEVDLKSFSGFDACSPSLTVRHVDEPS